MSLSEAISAGIRGDAVRYTMSAGRAVLPLRIGGTLEKPQVTIDAEAIARRAVQVAGEEVKKKAADELGKRLKDIFGGGK
jgi:hypothetical protein